MERTRTCVQNSKKCRNLRFHVFFYLFVAVFLVWREWHIGNLCVFGACCCISGAAKALARSPYQQLRRFWSLWLHIWGHKSIGANGVSALFRTEEFLNRTRVPIISRPWASKLCTVGAVDVLCVWTCLSSGPSVCFLQGLTNCFELHSGLGHVQFLSSS